MSFEEPIVDEFRGLSMTDLKLDQAYLNVSRTQNDSREFFIYLLNKDCVGCPLKKYDLETVRKFKYGFVEQNFERIFFV